MSEHGSKRTIVRSFALLGLSFASGALLFIADYPLHLWPLQWVALVPLMLAIERASGFRMAALSGAVTGLAYTVPLRVAMALPFPLGDAQVAYLTATWVVMALGFRWTCQWRGAFGVLGMAAVAVVVDWANVTLVPIWGTAQSFSRVCSASPRLVQIAALAGFTGVVFLMVATQALAHRVAIRAGERRQSLAALLVVIVVISLSTWRTWAQSPRGHIRVAAIGWAREREPAPVPKVFPRAVQLLRSRYEQLLAKAAQTSPHLVVTPESGFAVTPDEREGAFTVLAKLAARYHVTLAAGYFDIGRDTNLVRVIAPDGSLVGEYAKTHLIAFHEDYRPGDATPLVTQPSGDAVLGTMICHDDNFTDLARAYGRAGVDIVAVPTQDWREAKDYHLESSIFRAVENRYAVVRAASDGISAIISARGEILARMDHTIEDAGVVTADLPLVSGGTLYSAIGDWLPAAAAAFLLATGSRDLLRRRRRRAESVCAA